MLFTYDLLIKLLLLYTKYMGRFCMKRIISDSFTGLLSLQGEEQGYDSSFNINGDIVTIISLTDDCRKEVFKLRYTDGSNEKNIGYMELQKIIAGLQY